MKNNGLLNPFPNRVRELYIFNYECFNCGKNQLIELHHIFGRESSAAFNACPLCRWCHQKVTNTEQERAKYFFRNQEFLIQNHYKPTEEDFALIEKHPFLIKSKEFARIYGTMNNNIKNNTTMMDEEKVETPVEKTPDQEGRPESAPEAPAEEPKVEETKTDVSEEKQV